MINDVCACMGAMPGEPYCPCKMKQLGIVVSEEEKEAMKKFQDWVINWSVDNALLPPKNEV